MKASVRSILLAGALVMGANAVMASQADNTWFEQWYRDKYGRNTPAEEARQKAARENTTTHAGAATAKAAPPANDWYENWFKAKFGRSSPLAETRRKEAAKRSQANSVAQTH